MTFTQLQLAFIRWQMTSRDRYSIREYKQRLEAWWQYCDVRDKRSPGFSKYRDECMELYKD